MTILLDFVWTLAKQASKPPSCIQVKTWMQCSGHILWPLLHLRGEAVCARSLSFQSHSRACRNCQTANGTSRMSCFSTKNVLLDSIRMTTCIWQVSEQPGRSSFSNIYWARYVVRFTTFAPLYCIQVSTPFPQNFECFQNF